MAKFYGVIGYAITTETTPGVWVDTFIERNYTGDIVRNMRNWQHSDNVNPDITISGQVCSFPANQSHCRCHWHKSSPQYLRPLDSAGKRRADLPRRFHK